MALTGILGDITRERVSGVLYEREPELLTSDAPVEVGAYEALVRGAGISVILLTGPDPPAGSIRDLAVEAITLETGSSIEYAVYPEQQVQGEDGRGFYLHQRYLEKLAELRAIMAAAGGVVPPDGEPLPTAGMGLPRARMPEPLPYPDPVLVRGVSYADPRAYWEQP
jgi:hypothetical protein